jgi:hypothetical protein
MALVMIINSLKLDFGPQLSGVGFQAGSRVFTPDT